MRIARRGGETTLLGSLPDTVRVIRVERWDHQANRGSVLVSCQHPEEAVMADGESGTVHCLICNSRGQELPVWRAFVNWSPG